MAAYQRLIIDGYSLIHRDPETKALVNRDMRKARETIIEKVSRTATAMADVVTIVFDGQQGSESLPGGIQAVQIIYSPAGLTADNAIERMVQQADDASTWLIVTNDRRERETVIAGGAHTMSCAVFIEECQRMQRQQAQSMQRRNLRQPGPRLGDFFPDQ
ncbi:MAG TPA: NYN domain-containing protein [Kiritimatiellia bacterium]|nr:NYN domain-containing protein [Kiritimatiellia bacterium]